MVKCTACGKFLSPLECAKCSKCLGQFHRGCANLSKEERVSSKWVCPECKATAPRKNNDDTPIKSTELTSADESDPNTPSQESEHDLVKELRLFRVELGSVRAEMTAVRQELTALNRSVECFQSRLDLVEQRVTLIEERISEGTGCDNSELISTVAKLQSELNDRDQDLLLNDLEITCLPETPNESGIHLIIAVAQKLGVNLDERDVVSAERVGARRNVRDGGETSEQPRPRPLAVRLARRAPRAELLRAARVRRGADTAGLGLPGSPRRFYVNERLTKQNRVLFHRVREECTKLKWRFSWTRDGRIYVRRLTDTAAHRIKSLEDVGKVFGLSSIGNI